MRLLLQLVWLQLVKTLNVGCNGGHQAFMVIGSLLTRNTRHYWWQCWWWGWWRWWLWLTLWSSCAPMQHVFHADNCRKLLQHLANLFSQAIVQWSHLKSFVENELNLSLNRPQFLLLQGLYWDKEWSWPSFEKRSFIQPSLIILVIKRRIRWGSCPWVIYSCENQKCKEHYSRGTYKGHETTEREQGTCWLGRLWGGKTGP